MNTILILFFLLKINLLSLLIFFHILNLRILLYLFRIMLLRKYVNFIFTNIINFSKTSI